MRTVVESITLHFFRKKGKYFMVSTVKPPTQTPPLISLVLGDMTIYLYMIIIISYMQGLQLIIKGRTRPYSWSQKDR